MAANGTAGGSATSVRLRRRQASTHGLRHGVEVGLQAEPQGADPGPDQALHVGLHPVRAAALAQERQPGGQHEFPVEQVRRGVLQFARLHPAQPAGAVAAVVQDREFLRQLPEELPQGDEAEPFRGVSSHGCSGGTSRPELERAVRCGAIRLMMKDYRSFCTTLRAGSQP